MFSSITVIGAAGQTGQLFIEEISKKIKDTCIEAVVKENQKSKFLHFYPPTVHITSDIKNSVEKQSELIILATPNPIDEILETIAAETKNNATILLPQNGVQAAQTAQKILDKKKKHEVNLIRASLFTTVSIDKEGKAKYKANKLRIALSPISVQAKKKLEDLAELFKKAGFNVEILDNYKSMEWTKLLVNTLGSTASITGLTIKETFLDKQLFQLEMRALKDRLTIIKAAGIPFAPITWQHIQLLKMAENIPLFILRSCRFIIANLIIKGRENIQPAALRKIMQGKNTELNYYHKPFMDLGQRHGLNSPVDETIIEIIKEHEIKKINLSTMTNEAKKDLLLKTFARILEKPYFRRDLLITSIVELICKVFSKNLSVMGEKNLQLVRNNLQAGKSVIILANHLSHSDHPTLARAFREKGFPDLAERLVFVAGMRFKDEFIAKIFNNAYARTLVATPTSQPQTEEEKRVSQMINLKGFFEVSRLLNKGNLLVIYPEGTRSRDGKLLTPIAAVARYLENPNLGVILPAGIEGTNNLLPVGKLIPRFKPTKVTFGEPITPIELANNALNDLSTDKKNDYKIDKKFRDKKNEKIMNAIMEKIAMLLPNEQRGVYKK